jgi:hypothetical protein
MSLKNKILLRHAIKLFPPSQVPHTIAASAALISGTPAVKCRSHVQLPGYTVGMK